MGTRLFAVGLSASPDGSASRSGSLLDITLSMLGDRGVRIERLDLAAFPANGLLGRARSAPVDAALGALASSDLVLVATPIYRATYTGLLKVFFDLLPNAALAGKVAIPIASGGSPGHQLALEYGLRPLLASVGAVVVATGIYTSPEQFVDGSPDSTVVGRIGRAVAEALSLVRGGATSRAELVSNER
jgi:FMN reductase